jgi:hypothetical protein
VVFSLGKPYTRLFFFLQGEGIVNRGVSGKGWESGSGLMDVDIFCGVIYLGAVEALGQV